MAIRWWARFISAFGGPLLRANLVDMADDTLVENRISDLDMSVLGWNFSTSVDGTNPGASNLALNNAVKDNATAINFNTQSAIDNARFDEFLARLRNGNRIFLQQRNATNTSILFRVTGAPTVSGTRVDVPVARERDQGGEFAADALLNVAFFSTDAFFEEVSQTGSQFSFTSDVQIFDRNLNNVTLPVNAPYDALARFFFGGGSIQTDEGTDRVEYTAGYSQGVDYRDNAAGTINDATHYVDTDAGISISSNLASSTISYAIGTTLERLIVLELQLNTGNNGTGAMLVLLSDPGGTEREFVHVNLSNQIEIDTAPNSVTGQHQIVNDEAGAVTIDNGAWLILEVVPERGNLWTIVPAILLASGQRIDCNDVTVDMTGIGGEDLGISRSAAQRGQVLQYKTIQLPGYLRHNQLHDLFDHRDERWCLGFSRLFEGGTTREVRLVDTIRAPVKNTLDSLNITDTAIGGTGDSVLTLPETYTNFEQLMYTVVEDGGQTTGHVISTRYLEANASIDPLRISGNDSGVWNRTARTITLDSTLDTWVFAMLLHARLD